MILIKKKIYKKNGIKCYISFRGICCSMHGCDYEIMIEFRIIVYNLT